MREDGQFECDAERLLLENGCEGTIFLTNFSYDSALVGVTFDKRAVYNYDLMLEYLVNEEGFEDYIEAAEWVEYNTLGAISSFGPKAPIVYFPKDYDRQSVKEYITDHSFDDEEIPLIEELDECFIGLSSSGLPVYDLDQSKRILGDEIETLFPPPIFVKFL